MSNIYTCCGMSIANLSVILKGITALFPNLLGVADLLWAPFFDTWEEERSGTEIISVKSGENLAQIKRSYTFGVLNR
ncbi:MAG: hypothetical protein KL787_00640 [Taibaiella sp.]|nr:hypothetical protein [Taibaiella sp.]MBX9448298.1 hypothetical protein [Taibaiella sp.]